MTSYSDYLKQPKSRNIIHNGNFNIWQRGTAFPSAAGYTADRWQFGNNGSPGVFSVNISGSTPNSRTLYTYKITATTAQPSFTGSDYVHIYHKIEGYDFQQIANKVVNFSFWVYSSVAGTYSCFFRSSNVDYSLIKEFPIYQPNTWEYKSVSFYWDTSVGTYSYLNALGAYVGFAPACGSTYATSTIGEWIPGNYIASTNQTNFAASVNNVFLVSQIQLELGSVPTDFDFMTIEDEIALCYRYYQVIGYSHVAALGISSGTGSLYCNVDHYPKRATPTSNTITGAQIWSPQNGWRSATSTASTSTGSYRILFIFLDTGASNYVHSQGLLLIANCAISADL
jgi:hypothetical protein